jgi:thioesterase domain-containing protein
VKLPVFLEVLRQRDIQIWADGVQLRCNAPAGTLTQELRDELQQRKSEILDFLRSAGSLARQQRAIVPLQPHGTQPPIFAFGGHNGDVFCFRALARHLGADQPFFGLQPPGLEGREEPLACVEELAAHFAAEIRAFQPSGPFVIAGFCAGGTIAFELGRQLLSDGASIAQLVLFGAPYPTAYRRLAQLRKRLAERLEQVTKHARAFIALSTDEKRLYIAEKLYRREGQPATNRPGTLDAVIVQRNRVAQATFAALRRYEPGCFDGHLSLVLPCREWAWSRDEPLRWRNVAEHVDEYFGPSGCSMDVMLREPYAPTFARLFEECRGVCSVAGVQPLR